MRFQDLRTKRGVGESRGPEPRVTPDQDLRGHRAGTRPHPGILLTVGMGGFRFGKAAVLEGPSRALWKMTPMRLFRSDRMTNTYASPAFPRPATSAVFVVDLLADVASLSVAVDHRQHGETEWSSAPFPEIRGVGVYTTFIPELRDEYRWTLTVPAGSLVRVPPLEVIPFSEAPGGLRS